MKVKDLRPVLLVQLRNKDVQPYSNFFSETTGIEENHTRFKTLLFFEIWFLNINFKRKINLVLEQNTFSAF